MHLLLCFWQNIMHNIMHNMHTLVYIMRLADGEGAGDHL